MLKNYFKIALRNITSHKVFSIINIAGLALGLCACIVIYLVTSYELSFDRFHPDKERIYRVIGRGESRVPALAPATLRREIPGLEAVSTFYPLYGHATIREEGTPERKFDDNMEGPDVSGVIVVDPDYFHLFKYDWLAGSEKTSLQEPFKVVLTESRARKYFGPLSPDKMIGKTVFYDDSLPVTVSGIVKDWTGNSDFQRTDLISYSTIENSFLKNASYRMHTDWGLNLETRWPYCVLKLAKGAKPAAVNARFAQIVKSDMPEEYAHFQFQFLLQPLSDVHFTDGLHEDIRKAHLPTLYVLMGVAVFILLLAVINFVNLSTAQSLQRIKEIGVRKVLGGSRTSLVFQFLTETFVVTLFAVVIALLLVNPLLSFFHDFIPPGVAFHLLTPGTLGFIVLVTIGTSLLAGFYPAKVLSSYMPVLSLKGGGVQKGGEKWWLRKSLIVFQFSISLIFIIGVIVIARQIDYMLNTDFGFKTDARVSVPVGGNDNAGGRKQQVLAEKLSHLPGVADIAWQMNPPAGWGINSDEITRLAKEQRPLNVDFNYGNEAFIPFYGMHIVAGRNLAKSDSLREWVINESCSKALGFKKPEQALGQLLSFNGQALPVVGVVADFHESSFHEAIRPLVIGNNRKEERQLSILLASAGKQVSQVKATLATIEKIWKEVYPKGEFESVFVDQSIASYYQAEQNTARLMQAAMLTTIFISCMGLFGLALFTAQRKTKEIGIRKVLGAGVTDIMVLLTRDFVWLVVIALFIASPVAWILTHKWLQDFAYRIPVSVWIFLVAGLCAIAIALATVSFQAVKAAIANPVGALRSE